MVRLVRSAQALLGVLCGVSVLLYLMFYLPTRIATTAPPLAKAMFRSAVLTVNGTSVDETLGGQHNDTGQRVQTPGVGPGAAPPSITAASAKLGVDTAAISSSTSAGRGAGSVNVAAAAAAVAAGASASGSMVDSTLHGVLARSIYEAGHTDSNLAICPSLGADLRLLALVMSAPNHFSARQAIRQTWGHYAMRRDVAIAFLLGSTRNDNKLETDLAAEQNLYGDLIRGRFLDAYNNLTLKTISMLEWVDNFCPKTSYVLKTDDDMFININKLLAFAKKHNSNLRVIYGRLASKWKPIRNPKSKYFVSPQQYAAPVFPDFLTGPAYLIASCAVHDLYMAALNHTYLKLEDVFTTGIVAHQLGIKRVQANEFLNKRIAFNPCNIQKAISIHMVKYNEQFDLWKKLLDGKTKCK